MGLDDELARLKKNYDETVGIAQQKYEKMLKVVQDTIDEYYNKINEFIAKGTAWVEKHVREIERELYVLKEKIDMLQKKAEEWIEHQMELLLKKMNDKIDSIKTDFINRKIEEDKVKAEQILEQEQLKLKIKMSQL